MIGLVFILIFLFSQAPIRSFYLDKLKTHLTQVGLSLKSRVVQMYDAGQFSQLDKMVKELGKDIDIRITAIQPDGVVVADSEKPPAQMENHGHRPEILRAYKISSLSPFSLLFPFIPGLFFLISLIHFRK